MLQSRKRITATLFVGLHSNGKLPIKVSKRDVARGYSQVKCTDCIGTGWWAFFEPEVPGCPCVKCKGSGRIYITC